MTWQSPSPIGGERLLKGHSGRLFLAIAFGTFVANLGRQALPPLLPTIIADLAITSATAGIAMTLMRVAFSLCQYPSGRLADRVSRSFSIVFGLIGLGIGFLLLTRVGGYPLFLASTISLGIGAAFFFVASRVLLSDVFVAKRGRAFGINSAISRIGSILAAGLAIAALGAGDWRLAFVPVVGLAAASAVVVHRVRREPYRLDALQSVTWFGEAGRATIRRVFGTARVRWLVLAYTLVILAWEGIMAFLPAFLQASKGFTPAFAGGGFAALFAVGIVVQPLSGTASDRWDRRRVAGVATLGSLAGLGLLLVAESILLILLGVGLYAAGLMAFTPVLQAHLMDIFQEETKGGDLGAFKTVYEGLSSVGPTYVGVVAALASYTVAFAGFLVALALSAGILFWLSFGGGE